MTGHDFLAVAVRLLAETTEADWRSAVSRAYYAAFHAARQLFQDLGFAPPRADRCHNYLSLRLQNCGAAQLEAAGRSLSNLRQVRNQADYDFHPPLSQARAQGYVQRAQDFLLVLADALKEPTHTQITDAMKVYERDVLQDVTWQQP